ncbi:hypothetical protein SASPL_158149 [Salvia splendens]|uniref:Protein SYS1 n=1 Tax=Salvia splendens TaxID=180675 RepID=A0A8X8VTS3_SALSN|nr:hypothetical protein SASPL_158149 [Salvia splendens]
MFYGAAAWDPWLIVAQIVCLQCLYYLTLGLCLSVLVAPRVSKMSLVYFFDFATVTDWGVIASSFLTSIAGAGVLVYLVERTRKCLDFSSTLYIIHLFICLLYGGWPSTITWWVVNITGLAVMVLLGEHLCKKRELRDIPVGRYRSTDRTSASCIKDDSVRKLLQRARSSSHLDHGKWLNEFDLSSIQCLIATRC